MVRRFDMKKSVFVVAMCITTAVSAKCNLKLATASGTYLAELEKVKMHEYQAGGACTVLKDEYDKCSAAEKKSLGKIVDIQEVLGNICMPHLPPPPK